MKSVFLLFAVLIASPCFAADPFGFDEFVAVPPAVMESQDENKSVMASVGDADTAWKRTVELRLSDLERTSIDAVEAEEIAERVVKKYIKQLQLAVNTANGGQRIENVRFNSSNDGYSFDLAPGETLSSYTDPITGQVVRCDTATQQVRARSYSEPVPVIQTPVVEIRTQPYPVNRVRRVAIRPVVVSQSVITSGRGMVQTRAASTNRTGLFGRQITRSTARTCRIDSNGNQVCN